MRQNDRWDEVAGLVVRYRDAGVVGFDLAGPEIGFPPDRIPSAIAHARPAPARTARSTPARPTGIESIRAALDGAHAERLGHGVRIADEVPDDGPLGPVAQRVLDEQVPLEVAPSSNVQTGAYPSLAAHPVDRLHRLGLRRHRQHRQPADERGLGDAASSPTSRRRSAGPGTTSQTVTERALAAAFLPDGDRQRLLERRRPPGVRGAARLTPRGWVTAATPPPGNAASDLRC